MRWALLAIGTLVALIGIVAAIGAALPRSHKATVSARYGRPAAELWAVITDFASWPSWNPQIKRIERLPDRDGQAVWVLHDSNGKMPTRVIEATAPDDSHPGKMVTRIDDDTLPFGGTWTWEVVPSDGGSEVRITEDGVIHNVIFRFMARFVFGYEGTARAYLSALGQKFGENATHP